MKNVESLADKAYAELDLDQETAAALQDLRLEWEIANTERVAEMAAAINRQAAAIDRIQSTLAILVELLRPQLQPALAGKLPVAFQVLASDETPDVATAALVADPIALGFTLNQADVARVLQVSPATVSELIRAFKLDEDPDCSVVVRQGNRAKMVNYNTRAVSRFRELVRTVDAVDLKPGARAALQRARQVLGDGSA